MFSYPKKGQSTRGQLCMSTGIFARVTLAIHADMLSFTQKRDDVEFKWSSMQITGIFT